MSVVIMFLVAVAAVALCWLVQQGITTKPWLEQGIIGDRPGTGVTSIAAAKVGLGVFLTIIGCLFALLISAYFVRMEASDWRPLPVPNLLWFNTGVLILSSVGLQWASRAARKEAIEDLRIGLLVGGFCALLFLAGQLLVWRLFAEAGYYLSENPANSFFYLLTGLHGLHLAGGLVVLGWASARLIRGAPVARIRASLGLCTGYWHFLLALWIVLFAMLAGYAGDFLKICSAVFS